AYYEKKRAEGKKHNQAVRALGRHLVRVMWAMFREDRDYELREDARRG
ncbi:IS110 family transposase, partial [Candidatus Bipolaricaulota bacterium]|nr:IS110 family transposase [Candidatus Bipolaricaulota bacterium]